MGRRMICLCVIAALFGAAMATAFFATIENVAPTDRGTAQTEIWQATETPEPLLMPSETPSRPRMTPGEPPTYAPPYEWKDA